MPENKEKELLRRWMALWAEIDKTYIGFLKRWDLSLNAYWVIEYLHNHPQGAEPAELADCINVMRQLITIILNDLEQRRAQGSNELSDEARKQIDLLLKSKFRPEFLNRLDEIVYYKSLTKDEMRKIVDLQLNDLRKRMDEGKHLKLEVTTAAKDFIIDSAYDSVYGARPIKRFIQSRVETLIAKAIIKGNYAEGNTLTVDYDGSALVLR